MAQSDEFISIHFYLYGRFKLRCFRHGKGIAEDKLVLFVERIFDRNRRLLEYKNIVLEFQFRHCTFLQSLYFCIFTARQWNSIASVYFSILGTSSLIIQFNRDFCQ